MSETVALNSVVAAISEACFASCPVRKREVMFTLEQFQACDGYVEALVGIIDINSVGSTMKVDCRHLAAVLLKILVGKRPPQRNCAVDCVRNVTSNVAAEFRPLLVTERTALKSFLAGYLHEPECKVAIQLSLVTAKLARQDGDQWLKEWPELIPSLLGAIQANLSYNSGAETCASAQHANLPNSAAVNNGGDSVTYLRAVRGLACLSELLTELSSKASVCSSSIFSRNYAGLCAHLYPVVSKLWAENMKKLGPVFAKMNAQADASQTTATAYSLNVTGVSAFELESLVVLNILSSKVLRIVLEYGFELIAAKVATFFKTFFKCYLNAIKVIADFVRKHRPLCANIRQQRAQANARVCLCVGNKVSALPVLMKTQLMGDDDVDDLCDAYFPLDNAGSADEGALLSFINLTLKLMKSLVCAPVILQKKYPMLLLPAMNCLLDYYFNLLVEEYTYSAQPCEMSLPQPQVGGDATRCAVPPLTGASLSQLSADQQAWLCRQEEIREALPLNYLMKATAFFLSNVLSCSAYDEYNIYQQPPCALRGDDSVAGSNHTTTTASAGVHGGGEGSTMEESAEVKSAVAGACDLRKTFFSAERVTLIIRMLLYPMLTYSARELDDWSENPEEFVVSQLSAAENCSVKNAAQSLFCGLMELSPDVVCDILVRFLVDCGRQETIFNPAAVSSGAAGSAMSNSNGNNQAVAHWAWGRELKIWDAVYMCAGLGVAQLTPYFSTLKEQCESSGQAEACRAECPSTFTDNITPTHVATQEGASYWVQHYLGPMVQELLKFRTAGCLPQGQQLLRARLIWLLSIWMHKFDASVLQHVLTILIDIVGPASDSDIVVKMHAIQALEALINLEIFDISVLKFQVVSAVEALCLLVRSLQESDCKVTVLQVAGELIRLLSVQMSALKPLVVPLAEYLENLWSETVEADPSRCTILEVMALLVKAGKGHSASILAITSPLISTACQSASGGGSYRAAYSGASSSAAVGGGSSPASAAPSGPAACNGYLVKDGIALWLAVMQNLTEAQYATYHGELQRLLCVALEGLNFTSTESGGPCLAPCGGSQSSSVPRWDLFAEPDSAELVTDLMLVIEAYALLGGEAHCVLLDPCCRAAITALYCRTLGKVDAKVVQYVVRPLQAMLISCPILAGQYFSECGLLNHVMRILNASVGCPHLKKLMESHRETDLALVSYLTFVAQVLLLNPSALFSALTALKVEILTHIQSTSDQPVSDQILTESILLSEIVSLMFRLFEQLKYTPAPLFKCKLWALALLSLFPPTLVNNMVFIPPNAGPMNTSTGVVQKPICIISRTMLMIMDTVQFTMGRAKLEQHIRENCPPTQRMDFRSLSFWFPSTISAQQLYYWTEPILNICKGVLKDERSKKAKARMLRQLSALLGGGSSDGAMDIMAGCDESDSDGDDSDCECSSDEDSDDDNADALMSMKSSGSDLEGVTGPAETPDAEMGSAITAQNGDSLSLDVPELPIATVHRNRLLQSGLLTASIEAHLTEKLSQLCRTLGEEQFSTLRCIADLHL